MIPLSQFATKQFTIAVAEAMPEEHYSFKVDAEEISFGALMIHIATSQAFRVAQIAGKPDPFPIKQVPKNGYKIFVLDLLAKSFDYCIAEMKQLQPEQLEKSYTVDWIERKQAKGREILAEMLVHTAHHRGQAEVYMRAKGIKPPPYRF